MGYQLLNVLVFTLVGIGFVVVTVAVVSRLLRPRVSDPREPAKDETYECGEPAIGSSWVRFDIRFYTLALIFLVFDVEVALLYPWALVFKPLREAGMGLFVLMEVFLFLSVLGVAFVYCWRKGDLDWMKGVRVREGETSAQTTRSPLRGVVAPRETKAVGT
jgi:NADH-quinone oxidoreductase subunit A